MKYAYFPGCSQSSTAEEYNRSLLAVAKALGTMELTEIPDWNCCGATPAAAIVSPTLPTSLAARNLSIARDMGMNEIVAPCAACFKNLRKASHTLNENLELRAQARGALRSRRPDGPASETASLAVGDRDLSRAPEVRHPLDVVINDVGLDNVPVKKPLHGLKVASYYGCLLTRPSPSFDDAEHPTTMDRLMEKLGAEAVDWAYKTKCCGGGIYMFREDVSFAMSADVMAHAKAAGANCLAVGCGFCQLMLDLYQSKLEKIRRTTFRLPILFFSQLMGLAMDLDRAELGLEKLIVSPFALLAKTVDAPEGSIEKKAPPKAAKLKKWGEP
jgi:heterodisulfide reductase subunit B